MAAQKTLAVSFKLGPKKVAGPSVSSAEKLENLLWLK